MDEIGYEDYFYGEGLCMIEWANLIEEILPDKRYDVTIKKDLEKGFDYRENYPKRARTDKTVRSCGNGAYNENFGIRQFRTGGKRGNRM